MEDINSLCSESPASKDVKPETHLVFCDPCQDMPILEPFRINPRGPNYNTDKNAESIFITLGRYALPGTKESLLPGLSLQTIYNETKHLLHRWSESPAYSLSVDEKQFFDSFLSKEAHSLDMSEWEYLRDIFITHDSWFMRTGHGRSFRAYKVTVRELPPGIQLFKHLPPCRTLAQAKATIWKYTSVVNLGLRIEISQESEDYNPPFLFSNEGVMVKTENGETTLRRSARLSKGPAGMVDALKSQLHSTSYDQETSNIEDEDWSFDVDQQADSGFDDFHTDPETSIFHPGAPGLEFEGFSPENFQYLAEQLTLENGLTMSEEFAFSDLETQLKSFYNLHSKSKRFKKKSTCSTESPSRALKKSSLPTRFSDRLANINGGDTFSLRRFSLTSSNSSESADIEIISEEKAILTALKVPKEHISFPSPEFLREHGGKYIRDSEFIVPYDPDFPQSPLEEPGLQCSAEERKESHVQECRKEFCILGCVCNSIQGNFTVQDHCGKVKCQLGCVCGVKPVKVEIGENEVKDILSRLRPRSKKRKRSSGEYEYGIRNRRKTVRRQDSVAGTVDIPTKKRALTDIVKSYTTREPDYEDSYMGDIDMAETSSDDGTGSSSSPLSPSATLITISSDEDVYADENESVFVEGFVKYERESRRETRQRKKYGCQPCLVRTVEADMNLPVSEIEALCAPRVNYAEDRADTQKIARRLYMPLPLQIVEEENENRTICIVSLAEGHNAIINWDGCCHIPMASKTVLSVPPSIIFNTLITLPIPEPNETFFLFKIPAERDGDLFLHVHEMQFMLPLNQLHDALADTNNKATRRIQLVDRDQKSLRAPTGHPCEIFLFPTLPSIMVFGPFPVIPSAGPCIREASTNYKPWNPARETSISGMEGPMSDGEFGAYNTEWNGDGDLIPKDYYENIYQDYMIEFPEMDDSD